MREKDQDVHLKRVFGFLYRASDVDHCLQKRREEVLEFGEKSKEQQDRIAQLQEQVRQLEEQSGMLEQEGRRKDDVVRACREEASQYDKRLSDTRCQLDDLQQRLQTAIDEHARWHSERERTAQQWRVLKDQCEKMTSLCTQLTAENDKLRGENNAQARKIQEYQTQMESQNNELTHLRQLEPLTQENKDLNRLLYNQNTEISALNEQLTTLTDSYEKTMTRAQWLSKQIEQQRDEIAQYEKVISEETVDRAEKRAQRILQSAMEESDRIYREASDVRERVLAATRAAYYNAMQFRAALVERFSAMERDVDSAIDILRVLEIPQIPEQSRLPEAEENSDAKDQAARPNEERPNKEDA